MAKEKCETCRGKGKVRSTARGTGTFGHRQVRTSDTCPDCGGTGYKGSGSSRKLDTAEWVRDRQAPVNETSTTREDTITVSHPFELTDEEAITLRRVAFGESDVPSLRRADIERLLRLHLIVEGKIGMTLTISGKEYFDTLPRALFAASPPQRNDR